MIKLAPIVALLMAVADGAVLGRAAMFDTFGSGANTFDIEFVSIGNPGNAADTTGSPNPAGSVPYTYRMGKFEISEQMIDKANAVGGLGITKDTRGADKPATSVSWNEAARFVNWLNTSSGSTPAYKFAIQPGEVGYNANANIRTVDDQRRRLQPEQSLPQQLGAVFPAQRRRVVQGGLLRPDQRRLLRLSNRERQRTHGRGQRHGGWHGSVRSVVIRHRPCGHHAGRRAESLRDDGPGRQCL